MKRQLIFAITFVVFLLSINTAFADDIKNVITNNYRQSKDSCIVVKRLIKEEINTKEIVKTGVQLGHSACLIVKCAISGGGKLEEIIDGALEAGATTDVIAKCAVDAGANPQEVANLLTDLGQVAFCIAPEELLETIPISLPGSENQGGGVISPSSF